MTHKTKTSGCFPYRICKFCYVGVWDFGYSAHIRPVDTILSCYCSDSFPSLSHSNSDDKGQHERHFISSCAALKLIHQQPVCKETTPRCPEWSLFAGRCLTTTPIPIRAVYCESVREVSRCLPPAWRQSIPKCFSHWVTSVSASLFFEQLRRFLNVNLRSTLFLVHPIITSAGPYPFTHSPVNPRSSTRP